MHTCDAIAARRSIRKFSTKDIPRDVMDQIINAAIQAPSSKNAQPWRFVVVTEREKPAMLEAMRVGLEKEKKGEGLFPGSPAIPWAAHTLAIMAQAPVTVLVFNTMGSHFWDTQGNPKPTDIIDIVNLQSISAAIENMLLCATALGIGSLWICDIFFAYYPLCQWLQTTDPLVAAVSFGYPEESPEARPRKAYSAVVEWR